MVVAMTPPERFDRDWTVPPGETLKDWREENGLSQRVMATLCGRMPLAIYRRLEEGKERLTKPKAEALHYATGIPVIFWLRYEKMYREDLKAGRKVFP